MVHFIYPENFSLEIRKNVEMICIQNRYYIALEEFEDYGSSKELCISLAHEVDTLRDRIKILEEELKMYRNAN